MRNLLIAGLAAMSLIAFGACGGDEEETSTKECTSNADCGEGKICGAEGKCVDDTNVTPGPVDECTTNDDCTDATKPVCDNGTCVADSSVTPGPVDECTTNDDCTDATKPVCDNGTCVADNTQSGNCPAGEYEIDGTCYAEGDACDGETMTDSYCFGNKNVYCDYEIDYENLTIDYFIAVDDCAANDMTCGETADYGNYCVMPCDTLDEEIAACYDEDTSAVYLCVAMKDGTLGAALYDGEACDAGCDGTTGACTKLSPDEGETCDSTFTERCDGEVVVYCADSIVTTIDCGSSEGYSCGILSGSGIADCFSASDSCTNGDAAKDDCAYYGYYSAEYTCQETTDGEYYYYYADPSGETWDLCDNGCNATTGLCD